MPSNEGLVVSRSRYSKVKSMTAEVEKIIFDDLTEDSDGQLWGLSNPYMFGLRVHTGSSFCSEKGLQIASEYEVNGPAGRD